jgi:8-oxo-dGTP diphosphatase
MIHAFPTERPAIAALVASVSRRRELELNTESSTSSNCPSHGSQGYLRSIRHSEYVRAASDSPLRVIAACVIEKGRLLLVSKHVAPDVYFLPGGKPEPGESQLGCLTREVREELGAGISSAEPFGDVRERAALEDVPMHLSLFRVHLDQAPRAAREIASLAWWPDLERELRLGPAVRLHVIPRLRAAGALHYMPH